MTSRILLALSAAIAIAAAGPAAANSDDAAWIKRCVSDNKDEGQTAATLAAYCACMNNKMSENETLSISAWERTHPDEQEACSKEAGWRS